MRRLPCPRARGPRSGRAYVQRWCAVPRWLGVVAAVAAAAVLALLQSVAGGSSAQEWTQQRASAALPDSRAVRMQLLGAEAEEEEEEEAVVALCLVEAEAQAEEFAFLRLRASTGDVLGMQDVPYVGCTAAAATGSAAQAMVAFGAYPVGNGTDFTVTTLGAQGGEQDTTSTHTYIPGPGLLTVWAAAGSSRLGAFALTSNGTAPAYFQLRSAYGGQIYELPQEIGADVAALGADGRVEFSRACAFDMAAKQRSTVLVAGRVVDGGTGTVQTLFALQVANASTIPASSAAAARVSREPPQATLLVSALDVSPLVESDLSVGALLCPHEGNSTAWTAMIGFNLDLPIVEQVVVNSSTGTVEASSNVSFTTAPLHSQSAYRLVDAAWSNDTADWAGRSLWMTTSNNDSVPAMELFAVNAETSSHTLSIEPSWDRTQNPAECYNAFSAVATTLSGNRTFLAGATSEIFKTNALANTTQANSSAVVFATDTRGALHKVFQPQDVSSCMPIGSTIAGGDDDAGNDDSTNYDDDDDHDDGSSALSTAAVAGVVVGCIVGAIILVMAFVYVRASFFARRRHGRGRGGGGREGEQADAPYSAQTQYLKFDEDF